MSTLKGNDGRYISVALASGSSNDPVVASGIAGVLTEDVGYTTTGYATLQTFGVVEVSVKGIDGVGDSAVALGDTIYFTAVDDPVLNKKNTGAGFGIALGTVGAGETATIPVFIVQGL